MDYKTLMGYGKKKKKVTKESPEPKNNKILENVKKEFGYPINEWHHQPKTAKRWSKSIKSYEKSGLTEFEQQGGKDTLKEVGMSSEIKMYTHAINKNYDRYWDSVKELQKYLAKKGAQKISKQIGSLYTGHVGKFHHWMKTKFIQMVRKMI